MASPTLVNPLFTLLDIAAVAQLVEASGLNPDQVGVQIAPAAPHDYVIVPRGLLDVCLGLLEEANKHAGETATNWDDDMALALGQLRLLTK